MANNLLTRDSFPAGSSVAFIDSLIRQQTTVNSTSDKTNQNSDQLTQVQQAVNLLSTTLETTTNTASQALEQAKGAQQTANSAVEANATTNRAVATLRGDAVLKTATTLQTVGGPIGATLLQVAGVQVVGAQQTGFTSSTGTQKKGGMNADTVYSVGMIFSTNDAQAMADGLREVRQVVLALQTALKNHGLINA